MTVHSIGNGTKSSNRWPKHPTFSAPMIYYTAIIGALMQKRTSLNFYPWLHFITGLIAGTLAIRIWQRKYVFGRMYVMLLMAAVTIWSLGYGLELASSTLPAMHFWTRIEYFGIVAAPIFWLLFAIKYSGHDAWLTRRTIAALCAIPCITLLLLNTNEAHRLYYHSTSIDYSGPFPLLAIEPGPWYFVQIGYSQLTTVVGALLILWLWHQTPRFYRGQLTIMLAGALTPLAMSILYLLGLRPFGHIDLTAISLTLTGSLLYWGLYHYRLFDISPLARNALFEQMHDTVVILDRYHRIVDCNRAAQQQLRIDLPSMIGQPIAVALADWPELVQYCTSEQDTAEVQLARQPSHTYAARRAPLTDQRGSIVGAMVMLQDITARTMLELEREELIAQLHEQAHTDELTGIANRRAFIAAAERELQRLNRTGQPLATLLLDIDHFKQINDTYGHAAGDLVLQAVAQCCSQQIRTIDLLGRYGGEEFAILLPDTGAVAAREIAERLRECIATLEVDIGAATPRITISIGVAVVCQSATSLNQAFRQADAALYAAKRAGRNRVMLEMDMPSSDPPSALCQ